ncbi:MAG: carbohydrate kinase family protein [Candidatus Magnetoovum sp. WYHC-5]|nr:carbohydrate kinase family protein [Candidatus Magnetoovum sp. WYHC-5]
MNILISGSLAFDRVMDFPGRFAEHILPEKLHILNVCFMINELKENFGGTAGNIAYALSLFGATPKILATAGRDFAPYMDWLQTHNISTKHVKIIQSELTAGAYITTDCSNNQLTAFNPGAMKYQSDFDFSTVSAKDTIAIVSPGNLTDMLSFTRIYKEKGINYIFDPGQSLPLWGKEELLDMINGSSIFISNDYELELTLEKTDQKIEDLLKLTGLVLTTKGEHGSTITLKDGSINIPGIPTKEVKDPTGAGDAYRGGLIMGLLLKDKDIEHAAKMGALCATYAVEVYGTQNFTFTKEEFNARFKNIFNVSAFPYDKY